MKIERLTLEGACLIHSVCYRDERGFFTERFRQDKWLEFYPAHPGFVQENYSWSEPNVLRGLHYQHTPAQGKLVTCLSGSITDVLVDIRVDSPTFGQHLSLELDGVEPRWLWVPGGFAHGFAVTSPEGAAVLYKVDSYYNPAGEGAIAWNDPDLNIAWPVDEPVLSAKDLAAPSLKSLLARTRA